MFYGVGWERLREFRGQCSEAWVGRGGSCVVRDGEDWRVWVGEYCGEIAWILGRELVSIVAIWRGL